MKSSNLYRLCLCALLAVFGFSSCSEYILDAVDPSAFQSYEEVIPPEIRNVMPLLMKIYPGDNPPLIKGTYMVSPNEIIHFGNNVLPAGDDRFYLNYRLQIYEQKGNVIGFAGKEIKEDGSNISNVVNPAVSVMGSGNYFTFYFSGNFDNKNYFGGMFKLWFICSGEITPEGIANCQYAVMPAEGKIDEILSKIMVFKDADGLASKK